MARTKDKTQSKLITGLQKVMDRQNSKDRVNIVKINGQQEVHYKNKHTTELHTPESYYYPLLWKPLNWVVRKVPHTTYTYSIGSSSIAQMALRTFRRKKERLLSHKEATAQINNRN